jgi:hypothetical protein
LKEKINKKMLFPLLCLFSFLAGGINGLVGTAGGIIFVYMLTYLTKNDAKDNFATTICAVLPISLISSIVYFKNSKVDFQIISKVSIPCILGGLLGALIIDKIDKKYLSIIFACLVIYSGIKMILR